MLDGPTWIKNYSGDQKPTFGLHMRINLSIAIAVSVNIEPKKFISLIDSVITQGTLKCSKSPRFCVHLAAD